MKSNPEARVNNWKCSENKWFWAKIIFLNYMISREWIILCTKSKPEVPVSDRKCSENKLLFANFDKFRLHFFFIILKINNLKKAFFEVRFEVWRRLSHTYSNALRESWPRFIKQTFFFTIFDMREFSWKNGENIFISDRSADPS